jgi:hypothetical protein
VAPRKPRRRPHERERRGDCAAEQPGDPDERAGDGARALLLFPDSLLHARRDLAVGPAHRGVERLGRAGAHGVQAKPGERGDGTLDTRVLDRLLVIEPIRQRARAPRSVERRWR